MITYKKGNLLDATEPYIAHGCNSYGVMGSGVALAIKTKWPKAYEEYHDVSEEEGLELGEIVAVSVDGEKTILNCITQKHYGRSGEKFVSYDAVDECMQKIARLGIDNIAMPKIGAGLGGGDWKVIEAIINSRLANKNVVIYEID